MNAPPSLAGKFPEPFVFTFGGEDMKKCCGNCFSFMETFKTVSRSNHGKDMEKIQKKNFCILFHTEVNPNGKICRQYKTVDDVIEEGRDEAE